MVVSSAGQGGACRSRSVSKSGTGSRKWDAKRGTDVARRAAARLGGRRRGTCGNGRRVGIVSAVAGGHGEVVDGRRGVVQRGCVWGRGEALGLAAWGKGGNGAGPPSCSCVCLINAWLASFQWPWCAAASEVPCLKSSHARASCDAAVSRSSSSSRACAERSQERSLRSVGVHRRTAGAQ